MDITIPHIAGVPRQRGLAHPHRIKTPQEGCPTPPAFLAGGWALATQDTHLFSPAGRWPFEFSFGRNEVQFLYLSRSASYLPP